MPKVDLVGHSPRLILLSYCVLSVSSPCVVTDVLAVMLRRCSHSDSHSESTPPVLLTRVLCLNEVEVTSTRFVAEEVA